MSKATSSGSSRLFLNIAGFVTIAAVAVVGWFAIDDPANRWLAVVGLLIFAAVNTYVELNHAQSRRHLLFLPLQALIAFSLNFLERDYQIFGTLYFVLSAQVMLILPPRRAILWIGLFGILITVTSLWFYGLAGFLFVLPNFGGYLFFGTFGSAMRQAEMEKQRSQRLLEELQTAQSQLQELAVVEERNRLAREMHDSLGHRLTVAVVQLEGAQRLIPTDPDRAGRMIGNMRDQMKEALTDLRKTVATLRTPLDESLPLEAALTRLAQTFHEGTGLPVQLTLPPNLPPLPEPQRLTLFRAAQEALTNTQRHAKAKQAWLTLSATPQHITLIAADDGQGFPASANPSVSTGGFGLRGLTERAAQLGGQVSFQTRPGGGAQLQFILPLTPDSD